MKPSSDLFDLIHSLSPNEKRYFKRVASQHVIGDTNNYLRLFEAIARQKSHDEDALRQRFKGEKFIERLPSEKNYLFQTVLKAMRRYRADKAVDVQLQAMLTDARFLEGRGLYAASQKVLAKVKKLATQYELWPIVIEVLFREKDILVKTGHHKLEPLMEEAMSNTATALRAFQLQVENHDLFYQLLVQTRLHFHQRSEQKVEVVDQIVAQAHSPTTSGISFFGQLKHHHIHALSHQLKGEASAALEQFKAADALWRSKPHLLKNNLGPYIGNLSNVLSTCHFAGEFDEMGHHLKLLRSLKPKTWDEEGERLQNLVFFGALLQMGQGNLEAVAEQEKNVLNLLKQFNTKVNASRKRLLCYNLMVAFFLLENFGKAMHWADLLLTKYKSEQRRDAHVTARLFQLVIYFEREELDLVESQCRSIRRKLRKTESLLPLEERILDFAKRWVDGRLGENGYAWLLQRLQEPTVSPHAPGKGEFEIWCRARISGQKMVQVAQETLG